MKHYNTPGWITDPGEEESTDELDEGFDVSPVSNGEEVLEEDDKDPSSLSFGSSLSFSFSFNSVEEYFLMSFVTR